MSDRRITNQGSGRAGTSQIGNNRDDQTGMSPVFADPIGYLAGLGISAELVPNTDTNSPLPVAA